MSLILRNILIDSNNKFLRGATDNKVYDRKWFNRAWKKVIRPGNDLYINSLITYMNNLTSANSCFQTIENCIKAAGINIASGLNPNNAEQFIKAAGGFTIHNFIDSKYIQKGDILLSNDYITLVVEDDKKHKTFSHNATAIREIPVYSGPGEQYNILYYIKNNQNFTILSIFGENWYKVENGYIKKESVYIFQSNFDNEEIFTYFKINTGDKNIPLKIEPSNDSQTIRILNPNSVYTAIKQINDYIYISIGGWIYLPDVIKIN